MREMGRLMGDSPDGRPPPRWGAARTGPPRTCVGSPLLPLPGLLSPRPLLARLRVRPSPPLGVHEP